MYYGGYTAPPLKLFTSDPNDITSMDVKCWVLGDKLLSIGFKNYAMKRLYTQYFTTTTFVSAITTHDAQYAFENTALSSKLRRFYLDFIVQHFANPLRLKGTTEEWDELLLEHSDARLFLLQSFRAAPGQHELVTAEKDYMDEDESLRIEFGKMQIENRVS